MKVYIGADHRGYLLKEALRPWLITLGHEVVDCGNTKLDPEDDFPDFSFAVADAVAKAVSSRPALERGAAGIVICGSGGGVTIAANKVAGIRAVFARTPDEAVSNRQHNDINVLALAADRTGEEGAKTIITAFLTTSFLGEEKYVRRIKKIQEFELSSRSASWRSGDL
ncbi:RpiB/LacA/LacB family sugar-phosphate isomerase [Candidatus Gottesmanbacteria bacterium]|nr:RpiB/LacA/LacB family sugar-phosphate isomerase [Candidatus Gottesmanbacteria bacterium]